TNQSIVGLWKSVPDFHNHVTSFASTRSAGYTAYSDPDSTTGGYYRSLVTKPSLTSGAVISSGDTGTDPTSLVIPGRAEAEAATTWDGLVGGKPAASGVYSWTLRGTDAWENGNATSTGTVVVDTVAPTLTITSPAADSTPDFSPNGDGIADVLSLTATTSEA